MSSQIQITGETKVKSLTGVLVGTSGVVSSLNIDGSLGIPQLDVNGKIIVSQLPNSVMEYKGTWDASTNTPTLVNGTGNQGDVYLCSVAGTVNFGAGAIAFVVSDQVIYSGSIWQKASGTSGTVTSVAASITGNSLGITGSPITTAGTLAFAFAGTNLQYVNGAGNLTTFPILTGYVTSVTGTAPVVSSGGTTPAISMAAATTSVNGYLTSTDWTTFNSKEPAITSGTTLQYYRGDKTFQTLNTSVVPELTNLYYTDVRARAALSFVAGSGAYNSTTGVITIPTNNTQITNGSNYITLASLSASTGISYNNTTGVITNSLPDQTVALTASTGISVTGTYPNFTITNTSPSSGGTVTSVAALTLGTSGTDLSSTVATSTTTPVITLNVPTASATNRGALSSADWSTFNGKESVLTFSSPLVRTTNTISIPAATTSVNGYLTSTDWTTFNSKQGTITLTTTGSSGAATFSANTLNIPNYGSALSGYIPYTGTGISVYGLSAIGEYDGGAQIPAGYGGNYALTLGNGLTGNNLSLYATGNIVVGGVTCGAIIGTSAKFSGNVITGSTSTPLSPLQVVGTGTVFRYGEQSGTTGKQILFGLDATTGRGEIQAVWQGTGATLLALNPSSGSVLVGFTASNGDRFQVNGTGYFASSVGIGVISNASIRLDLGNNVGSANTANQISLYGSGLYGFGVSSAQLNYLSGGVHSFYNTATSAVQMSITSGGSVLINRITNPYESTYKFIVKNTTDKNIGFGIQEGELSIEAFNDAINVPKPLRLYASKFSMIGGDLVVGGTSSVYALANRTALQIDGGTNGSILGLNVNSSAAGYFYADTTDTYIYNNRATGKLVAVSGTNGVYLLNGGIAWVSNSDERLKTDLLPIENAANKVSSLRACIGRFKTDEEGTKRPFLIAQDVLSVLPEAVNIDEKSGMLGIAYTDIIPLLVAAIKEQQSMITSLQDRLYKLENK